MSIVRCNKWITPVLVYFLLSDCYPGEDFTVEELDTVSTFYESDEDYSSYTTFAVPDSVVRIGGDMDDSEGKFDALILEKVRSNMRDLGYLEETDAENNTADLVVLVELLVQNNTVIAPCYPGWGWWYWPPGWGPGWCGGFPGVPVGQYTTGTITLNMITPGQTFNADEEVQIIWSAFLNGLVTGSDASIQQRIETNVDQAFVQSSYLGR
ncbi:MAG: hypothetical protein DHS20C17_12930 [Cyclobacteriaceae bacterium]|nr:MAG: hypothetical protein DHS20C17_12930 [Cyclobacteriaceae bacterium]